MDTLVRGQLCLQSPGQNPVLLNSYTNCVFSHSHKQPAPVTDSFFRTPRVSAYKSFYCILLKKDSYTFIVPVKIIQNHLTVAMNHEVKGESLSQLYLCLMCADLDSV